MKLVASIFLAIFFLSSVPVQAEVKTVPVKLSAAERSQLLETISSLLREVIRLQTLLQQSKSSAKICTTPKTILFNRPVEAEYCVVEGGLVRSDGGPIRSEDQSLFNLFKAVLGAEAVNKSVTNWRIFNDEDSAVDAFVETSAGSGQFMVSVNRSGYQASQMVKKSYAELFIHEYAHIIFLEQPKLVKDYSNKFWTAADQAQATRLGQVSTEGQLSERLAYFNKNSNRFVSDYATLSVDEDMAETFRSGVVEGLPSLSAKDTKAEKQRFFLNNKEIGSIQTELRQNLTALSE